MGAPARELPVATIPPKAIVKADASWLSWLSC